MTPVVERSNRIAKGRRRVFSDQLIFVIDPPVPIEKLSDFHFGLRIRSSVWAWGNIQGQSSNPNSVVIADDGQIAEADDSIQIQMLRDFSPGLLGFSGIYGKTMVETLYEASQEDIGLFNRNESLLNEVRLPDGPAMSQRAFRSVPWLEGRGHSDRANSQSLQS